MAGFGVDATGTYEANNFLTAKAKPVDESKGMLIKTLGDAAVGAAELYVKNKEVGFREEVQQTIDLAKAQDFIGPDENTDEIIAEVDAFRKQNKKAEQVFLTSGQTTKERVALQIEGRYRELVSKRPWLAKAYARASETVLAGNQATLSLLDTVQRAYLTDGNKSAEEERKDLLKEARRVQGLTGENPEAVLGKGITLDQGTNDQIREFTAKAGATLTARKEAEAARQNSIMLAQERAAAAQELGAASQATVAEQARKDRQARDADISQYNSTQKIYNSSVNSRLVVILNQLSGNVSPEDWKAVQQDAMLFAAESKRNIEEHVNSHEWFSPTEKERLLASIENKTNSLLSLFTGDLNQAQTISRQLQASKGLAGLDFAKAAPDLWRLEQAFPGIGALLGAGALTSQNDQAATYQGIQRIKESQEIDPVNYGNLSEFTDLVGGRPLDSYSASELSTLRKTSRKTQLAIYDPSNPVGSIQDEPKLWGYTLDTILTGGLNKTDYDEVTKNSFNREFATRFQKFSEVDPERAQILGAKAQDTARNIANDLMIKIRLKDSLVDNIHAYPNGFVADNILNAEVQGIVNRLNNILGVLVATYPTALGLDESIAKETLMQEVFGIRLDEAPGGPN